MIPLAAIGYSVLKHIVNKYKNVAMKILRFDQFIIRYKELRKKNNLSSNEIKIKDVSKKMVNYLLGKNGKRRLVPEIKYSVKIYKRKKSMDAYEIVINGKHSDECKKSMRVVISVLDSIFKNQK